MSYVERAILNGRGPSRFIVYVQMVGLNQQLLSVTPTAKHTTSLVTPNL